MGCRQGRQNPGTTGSLFGLSHKQKGLNMDEEQGKLMAPNLKEITNEDNLKELKKKIKLKGKEKTS